MEQFNTVNVENLKTDVLLKLLSDMKKKRDELNKNIYLVQAELSRRQGGCAGGVCAVD